MTTTTDRQVENLARILEETFDRMFERAQATGDTNTLAGLAHMGHAGSRAALARRHTAFSAKQQRDELFERAGKLFEDVERQLCDFARRGGSHPQLPPLRRQFSELRRQFDEVREAAQGTRLRVIPGGNSTRTRPIPFAI